MLFLRHVYCMHLICCIPYIFVMCDCRTKVIKSKHNYYLQGVLDKAFSYTQKLLKAHLAVKKIFQAVYIIACYVSFAVLSGLASQLELTLHFFKLPEYCIGPLAKALFFLCLIIINSSHMYIQPRLVPLRLERDLLDH